MALYTLDYKTTAYASVTVEAESRSEAFELGCKLLENRDFIEDVLMPRFGEDFDGFAVENMDWEPDVTEDGEQAEDVSIYLEEEQA
jgi:hypothetical protein